MDISIRLENPGDYRVVEELVREAFWNVYAPGCDEHFLLHNLRECPEFISELDFIGVDESRRILGSIVYSRSTVTGPDGVVHETITFGPVSVMPEFQGRGIGSALINYSLEAAGKMGFNAVLITGEPKYYSAFGFRSAKDFGISLSNGEYSAGLMALELSPGVLSCVSGRFSEATVFQGDKERCEAYDATFPAKKKCITQSQINFLKRLEELKQEP